MPFAECHVVGLTQSAAFADWLLSLSKMHLRFLLVVSWLASSCSCSTEYSSIVWTDHLLFIHSAPEGHLGCSQVLAIMNRAAINISVQVSGEEQHTCFSPEQGEGSPLLQGDKQRPGDSQVPSSVSQSLSTGFSTHCKPHPTQACMLSNVSDDTVSTKLSASALLGSHVSFPRSLLNSLLI